MNKITILLFGLVSLISVIITIPLVTVYEDSKEPEYYGAKEVRVIDELDSVMLFKETFPHYSMIFDPTAPDSLTRYYAHPYALSHIFPDDWLSLVVTGKYNNYNNPPTFETIVKLICDKKGTGYTTTTTFLTDDISLFQEKLISSKCYEQNYDANL